MKWRDVTSHGRGEDRAEPRSWETTAGGMRLTVTRFAGHDPAVWVMFIAPRLPDEMELDEHDVEKAKAEAVAILRHELQRALAELGPAPKS